MSKRSALRIPVVSSSRLGQNGTRPLVSSSQLHVASPSGYLSRMRGAHVLFFGAAPLTLHCGYTVEHTLAGAKSDGAGGNIASPSDQIPGAVGGAPQAGSQKEPADFVRGGRGTAGTWDGYLFPTATSGSPPSPTEFIGSELCIYGELAPGYEEWAAIGWHIAQVIDAETFEGGEAQSITPGGTGVEVEVLNNANSAIRVDLYSDASATESWCAPTPPHGGIIPWSSFKKDCWLLGGEPYDGVTPLSTILVTTFGSSATQPTPFDYCVLHIGPT